MQHDPVHVDRGQWLLPALLVAVVAALALWAGTALGSGDPASAATSATPAVDTRPVQQEEAPAEPEGRGPGDCPEKDGQGDGGGGGGGETSQAPQSPDAGATPDV